MQAYGSAASHVLVTTNMTAWSCRSECGIHWDSALRLTQRVGTSRFGIQCEPHSDLQDDTLGCSFCVRL